MTKQEPSLSTIGINADVQHWNLVPAATIEAALRRNEGQLTAGGCFLAVTSPFTGRSPKDKFIVREASTEGKIWWGSVNQEISPENFYALRDDVAAYLSERELFVRDLYACADPDYQLNVRLISESAWHTLFANNLFRRFDKAELATFTPDWQILHAPEYRPIPAKHGTRQPDG